jgi:predicted nucleotidyltransferase
MVTKADLLRRRDEILAIARRHGAFDVRIFGSLARGDAIENSDLDLVVRFDPGRTLLDHAGLIGDLEDLLEMKVDVIDADGMHPRFRGVIEREALPL